MNRPFIQVLATGLGMSVQDDGRPGWRRLGVPVGGVMDAHAALWARRLVGEEAGGPVVEMLLQGARLAVLREAWIAVTGADASASVPMWRPVRVGPGDILEFPRLRSGTWVYLAVAGGLAAPRMLGSASVYPRGQLGRCLAVGDLLWRERDPVFALPEGVAGRLPPAAERRDYDAPPRLRVWPGPQVATFSREDRERFFGESWRVSSRSDRVGYRLDGPALGQGLGQGISEPMRVGTVQVPAGGTPMVMMRDGPTVGGYPKLAVMDPADVSWLAQCRPGREVRFQPMEGAGSCAWT